MAVSNENKRVANEALKIFGGKPRVVKFWDDSHESSIDILMTEDRPVEGICSFSTIGLFNYSIGYSSGELSLRVEFVAACDSSIKAFPNILASCAFNVINTKLECRPGTIFNNVVSYYEPNSSMAHVIFVPPFLWEDQLQTISFPDMQVTWLLAVPISVAEAAFANANGSDALEELFERHQIDVFNLYRKSIL